MLKSKLAVDKVKKQLNLNYSTPRIQELVPVTLKVGVKIGLKQDCPLKVYSKSRFSDFLPSSV